MKYRVLIKPNSKKGPIVEKLDDGSLMVYVREMAIEGKANEALVKLLAKYFNVPKSRIEIIHGHKSQHKIVEINKS